MGYTTILFDMDGTLMNTLEDMADSVNAILRQLGHAERSLDEVRAFVGNGAEMLVRRAMPDGSSEEEIAQALGLYPVLLPIAHGAHQAVVVCVFHPGSLHVVSVLSRFPAAYLHSSFCRSSSMLSTIVSAPEAISFSRPRKPQLTPITGRPAFFPVCTSTSESPT